MDLRPVDSDGPEAGLAAVASGACGLPGGRRRTAFELIGAQVAAVHARGARTAAPAHPGKTRLSHQPSDAFTAHPAAVVHEFGMHPRRPIGTSRFAVNCADPCAELLVTPGTTRRSTATPRVVPAGGDVQHPAHRDHPVMGLVRLHELEDLPGTVPVSRANQAAAFFKFSRSSRS